MSQEAEDIAELIASVYRRTADRDEFMAAMNAYPYIKEGRMDSLVLFALCNKTWHHGYHEGFEDQ